MSHEIEMEGCLTVPDDISLDDAVDEFLAFIGSRSWYFGGGFQEFHDDYSESIEVKEED